MKTIELDVTWGKVAQETVDFQSPWAKLEDDDEPDCRLKAVYLDQFYSPVGGRWYPLRFGYEEWDFGLDKDRASYVVFL